MFKKGQPGRPTGSRSKQAPFCLPTVIINRFPASKTLLEQRVCILDTSIASPGRDHYKKYLAGQKTTLKQRVLANCCMCNGYYGDGKNDCEKPLCPLYPDMPYRQKESK
jgi:hypothetical protein